MPTTANTTTVTHATWTGYDPKIISIDMPGYTLEPLDDSDLTTTGFKTMVPGDLQEISEMTLEVRIPNDTGGLFTNEVGDLLSSGVVFDATVGSVVILFPQGVNTTAPKLTGTAFVTGFQVNSLNNDDRMTATVTIQFDGATGPTYTVGVV